jgi:hypothetical protein
MFSAIVTFVNVTVALLVTVIAVGGPDELPLIVTFVTVTSASDWM